MSARTESLLEQIERRLARIEVLLSDEDDLKRCPKCKSSDLEDTSVSGLKRLTCLSCGKSESQEVARG